MPVPTIFLIDDQHKIVEMSDQPYDSEELLQELLAEYPNVLAGDQMGGTAPVRWLMVAREAGIPGEDGGSDRFSLDHVFIDQNAIPTLVEVKRSSDTRIRREVVGQMLDYAANAVLYWPVDDMRRRFEETCRGKDQNPDAVVAEFIGKAGAGEGEGAIKQFWDTVETNLRAGKLRLIFAADQIPPELRRVVEFLNEQMNPAEVLAIEIRQYVGSGIRTLVPSVIRSSKRATTSDAGRTTFKWDQDSFLKSLRERKGPESAALASSILDWTPKHCPLIWWGEGRKEGSCYVGTPHGGLEYYPFAMWTVGLIQLQYKTLQQRFVPVQLIEKLTTELNTIPGVQITADSLNKYPSFDMALLKEPAMLSKFLSAIQTFVENVKTTVKANAAKAASV